MENKTKRSFFTSLRFQTIAVNAVMLVLLIVTLTVVSTGITKMNQTAASVSSGSATVTRKMGEVETLVEGMYAEASIVALAQQLPDEAFNQYLSNYNTYRSTIEADLEAVVNAYAYTSTPGLEASLEQAKKTQAITITFMDEVKTVYDMYGSGDRDTMASAAMGLKSSLSKVNVECKAMNDLIDKAVGNIGNMLESSRSSVMKSVTIIFIILALIMIANIALTYTRVNIKITSISSELQEMISKLNAGRGDLTARVQTKSNTELKNITDSINEFISSLQEVLREVKDSTVVLGDSSSIVTEKVQKANDSVTNTSAALEELSASMENVSVTAGNISGSISDVRNAVDDIEAEAESGASKAVEIQKEANAIKVDAGNKKETTGSKVQELSEILTKSVKDSEKVSEIGNLTDEILNIASQTNLLALNASIEAARAGDAGKGFAVVAEEITQLASNSRDTAENIRTISQEVTEAVQTLSENATSVIDFINTTVLSDYDAFVETGEKYENTADIIEEMTARFKEKSDHLGDIMNDMANGVDSITNSVQESSTAISMSAENSTEIVSEILDISEAINENNKVADRLTDSAAKFEFM